MNAIFVGGSNDGRRISIAGPLEMIRLPRLTAEPNLEKFLTATVDARPPTFDVEDYRRFSIRAGERQFWVYALSSLEPEQIMEALIEGYKIK